MRVNPKTGLMDGPVQQLLFKWECAIASLSVVRDLKYRMLVCVLLHRTDVLY